jgi:hypothetical protein
MPVVIVQPEWVFELQRGLIAGRYTGDVCKAVLRILAREWAIQFRTEKGVTAGTVELRCVVDMSELKKAEGAEK